MGTEALNNPQVQIDTQSITPQMVYQAVGALEKLTFERLEAMDKAVQLLQDNSNRSPTINEVYLQHEEKFDSVQKQFEERDIRVQDVKEAATTAVNAALTAVKESSATQTQAFKDATAKSEQQFTKQIDQQGELQRSEVKALNNQITEINKRLDRESGRGEGVDKNKTDNRLSIGMLIAAAGLFITAMGAIIGAVIWIATKGN